MLGVATNPSGASGSIFSMRFKRIDVSEFQQLASSFLQQSRIGSSAASPSGHAPATAPTPTVGSSTGAQQAAVGADRAVGAEAQIAAFMNGPLVDFAGSATSVPRMGSTAAAPASTTAASTTTASPATSAVVAAAPATSAQSPATSVATAATPVAIPASTIAPRRPHDYWTSHIAQFRGAYLPDGPQMRPNCGPASVTMALRMIGLDIPGFSGQRSSAVLDQARIIATGRNDTSVGTTDAELERLISAAGGRWSESQDFNQLTGWVKQGIPVVMSGNPAHGWNRRYSSDKVYPFDGGHWVTVSGYDPATGHFIVNDPLSQIGPIYVSEQELRSYNHSHGQLGIAVFR
jgi:hypothetical protein